MVLIIVISMAADSALTPFENIGVLPMLLKGSTHLTTERGNCLFR